MNDDVSAVLEGEICTRIEYKAGLDLAPLLRGGGGGGGGAIRIGWR